MSIYNDMSFGLKVQILRKAKNMSQSELAENLKLTQTRVSYLERMTFAPAEETLIILSEYFNVPTRCFLIGEPLE